MTRQTQLDMHQLMQHFYNKTQPERGLRYADILKKFNADYSDTSLEQLNQFLIHLHTENIRPNDLVTTIEGLNFLMMIAGYLCETINQRTSTTTIWYSYH